MAEHIDSDWGQAAPKGVFKYCLDQSRVHNSKTWSRLAGYFAPQFADVETLDFKARLYPKDNLSEKRLLLSPGRFDPVELAYLSALLKPGFVFVDVGANCGAYTLHLAVQAPDDTFFFAIEAQPEMARRFRFNAAASAPKATVALDEIALSDKRGTLEFHINRHNRGESGLGSGGETIKVEALTLADYVEMKGIQSIDAMKIDVEGFEHQILAPFFETATESRWPACLIVEQILASPETDPVALAISKGYRVRSDLGRNVILVRDG
ncbi:FkbM family methyltransferase [Hyphobacterium sp.]|uniref:FkbM family methyltransferase n=1 Tax=Hyphobacterium sp. TaxID=2004662 RepID=UPI003BAA34E6